jgi:tetraacyldisaccharide 4'-kinase
VVLDSGFQHRRLRKDLDIVVVDDVSLELPQRRLPAGPFREPVAALSRADLVVVIRRYSRPAERRGAPETHDPGVTYRLVRHVSPLPPLARARIVPIGLRPVTPAARHRPARPRVAVAGIMWPHRFFAQLRELAEGSEIEHEIALSDHAVITEALAARLVEAEAGNGIVCTLKDAGKLACRLGDEVPLWYVAEEVVWQDADAAPAPLRAALALLPSGSVTRAREPGP